MKIRIFCVFCLISFPISFNHAVAQQKEDMYNFTEYQYTGDLLTKQAEKTISCIHKLEFCRNTASEQTTDKENEDVRIDEFVITNKSDSDLWIFNCADPFQNSLDLLQNNFFANTGYLYQAAMDWNTTWHHDVSSDMGFIKWLGPNECFHVVFIGYGRKRIEEYLSNLRLIERDPVISANRKLGYLKRIDRDSPLWYKLNVLVIQ